MTRPGDQLRGRNVRVLRTRLGLTRKAFAERFGLDPVHVPAHPVKVRDVSGARVSGWWELELGL